ncbi:MAG: hypothetical protein WBM50_16815 [Acidimicrobiales bacterium]
MMRHPGPAAPGVGGEDAEIRGVLELEGDCLYVSLAEVGERYPLVWPAATTWDPDSEEVVLPDGSSVAIGDMVYGGGGYHYADDVRRLAGDAAADLADRCVDNEYGEIAVVNNGDEAIGVVAPGASNDAAATPPTEPSSSSPDVGGDAARAGLTRWIDQTESESAPRSCPAGDETSIHEALTSAGLSSTVTDLIVEVTVVNGDTLPLAVHAVTCSATTGPDSSDPATETPIYGATVVVIDLADTMTVDDFSLAFNAPVWSGDSPPDEATTCRVQRDPDRNSVRCEQLRERDGLIIGASIGGMEGDITPDLLTELLDNVIPTVLDHLARV